MLTAFQIGLSCRSQPFLFLSEPEFRAFIGHYRERESEVGEFGKRQIQFCLIETLFKDSLSLKKDK